MAEKKATKKKIRKSVERAKVFVTSSYNNTIVTVTDESGNVLSWSSAGSCGFKGTKQSTPYAAQIAAETAMEKAEGYGIKEVDVFVKGLGVGRDQAVRGVINSNSELNVLSISDITPIPHGGVRKKKVRRN